MVWSCDTNFVQSCLLACTKCVLCVLLRDCIRAGAQALFFLLTVTFFLLSAGETHPIVHKVSPILKSSSLLPCPACRSCMAWSLLRASSGEWQRHARGVKQTRS